MGRPSKKDKPTGETISQKFLGAIELGLSEKSAAELCGVSESTVNLWKKDDDFRSAVLEARGKAKEFYVKKLRDHAEKQVGAVMFWLSRRTTEFREEQPNTDDADKLARLGTLLGAALVSASQASSGTPGNKPVSDGDAEIQGGTRGPSKLQDGTGKEGSGS